MPLRSMVSPMSAARRACDGPDMSIISWLALGTLIGVLSNWILPGRFPGGLLGTIAGGTAGAFLGGAIFTLLAGRGVSGFDLVSLLIALVGAGLLLAAVRKAAYTEPWAP
jgi:uncharacterized membrane protein YeaQ/YmgE (transglycosylase-associated protein family)